MTPEEKYIADHSSPLTDAQRWIIRQTHIRTNHARMLSGAVQGRFLTMLVELTGAARILELGTFTGYSAVCLAMGLPEGGHLDTLEVNDELEDLILEGFRRAALEDRITLHVGDAKEILGSLGKSARSAASSCPSAGSPAAPQGGSAALYDMVYIDANKREYCMYYDLVFDLVRPGGLILADNVLWDGKVFQEPLPRDRQTAGIASFNDMVASDPRVESVILPLRDGLNVIRKR
ncbi:MAG: class I SAM-dependent methyltransferase [Bacteroidetes bacterium]|uniref:Class I SAM-dependent methyltransferase n=1 Tax=Candidatus Cryptobacteroides excrementipullorum TaxID=2840761 RepID=A0A9D9ITD6_9BACT|nr:class I SAM-dependent methyltransferase [Candidatus Cryptobacteroides excrementipullorum]